MIYIHRSVLRPCAPADDLPSLRLSEAALLQGRANEILNTPGLRVSDVRTGKLLNEEAHLHELAPRGIQGWNVFSDGSPELVVVGQNPYMMSYVEQAEDVVKNFSSPDLRAIWLATGCVLALRGTPGMKYLEWKQQIYKSGVWRELMKSVAFVNATSYRYYVSEKNMARIVKTLSRVQRTLGSQVHALDSLSQQIVLATSAIPSVKAIVVARKDAAFELLTAFESSQVTTSSRALQFVGISHWGHWHIWRDAPEVMRLLEDLSTAR